MSSLRPFLLLVLIISCLQPVIGQQQKFEAKRGIDIRIGYGVGPVQSLQNSFHEDLLPILDDDNYINLKKKGSGMFSLSLMYQTASRLSFGFDAVYGNVSSEFSYSNLSTVKPQSKWFAVMAKANYTYYQDVVHVPHVEMYGGIALGSAFRDATLAGSDKSLNSSHLAYQITPFGIRTGQKIGFWAELGYGFKGFINAGVCARL